MGGKAKNTPSNQKTFEEDEDQTASRSRTSDAAGGGHDDVERFGSYVTNMGATSEYGDGADDQQEGEDCAAFKGGGGGPRLEKLSKFPEKGMEK
jgi:hypothetical protein